MKRSKAQQKKIDELIRKAEIERKKIEISNIGLFKESVEIKKKRVKTYSQNEIKNIIKDEKEKIDFEFHKEKYSWLQDGICSDFIIGRLFVDKRLWAHSNSIINEITLLDEILKRKKKDITPELSRQRAELTVERNRIEYELYEKYIWTEIGEKQILVPIIEYLDEKYVELINIFENIRKQLDKIRKIVKEEMNNLEIAKRSNKISKGEWIGNGSIKAIEDRKLFIEKMLNTFSKKIKGGKKMSQFPGELKVNTNDEPSKNTNIVEQQNNEIDAQGNGKEKIQEQKQQQLDTSNVTQKNNVMKNEEETLAEVYLNSGQAVAKVAEDNEANMIEQQVVNNTNVNIKKEIQQEEITTSNAVVNQMVTTGAISPIDITPTEGSLEKVDKDNSQNKNEEITENAVVETGADVNQNNTTNESQADIITEQSERVQSIEKYNQILREQQKYKIENGKLREGSKDIADCLIIVTGKIEEERIITNYKLKCISLREPEREFEEHIVSARDFEKFNVLSGTEWEEYCFIEVGSSNRQKMKEISLLLGRGNIKVERKFNHTGYVMINGNEYYIYHGGSISVTGNEKIEADLSQDGLSNYSFTDKNLDIKESIITSSNFLKLAEYRLTIPLYSTLFLAPLVSKFQEIGINIDYVVFLVGPTNSRKSCASAVLLSHFGSKFDKDNLPASFKGTTNQLEVRSHILKDSLIIVNDFGKEVQGRNKIKLLSDLFEIFGDRQSRERMNSNGSLQKTYKARGLAIINGEVVPSELSESRLARSIILTLNRDSIKNEILTLLQHNQDKLSVAMQEYIKWIMCNEDRIKEKAKSMFEEFRARQNNEVLGRINDSVNIMEIGFSLIMDFWKDYGIIDEQNYKQWNDFAKVELEKLITNQKDEVENANPINMFYSGLEELFRTNRIYVVDYKDGKKVTGYNGGRKVGYIDTENKLYYFHDKTIYDEVRAFYGGKNGDFEISRLDLWRLLDSKNLLFRNDNHTKKVIRVDPDTKQKTPVVAVRFREVEDYT